MKRSFFFLSCFFWIFFLIWPCDYLLAGDSSTKKHKVAAGESIRGLLLQYGCISSMLDYAKAREDFAKLNPGIFHSALLAPGATVSMPVSAKDSGGGCLSFAEQRIVRVEFETTASAEQVRIYLDGPVLPDLFMLKKEPPVRVVCDFDGVLPIEGLPREILSQGRIIRKIRVGHEDKPFKRARVVLEVDEALTGRVEQEFFERESLFLITIHEGVE